MKHTKYLISSMFVLAMMVVAQPAFAVYTNTVFEGAEPDKIKTVKLVLPGNEETELELRGDAWFLNSDDELAIGTTGTVVVTNNDDSVSRGTYTVGANGISISITPVSGSDPSSSDASPTRKPSISLRVNQRNTQTGDNNAGLGTRIRLGGGEFAIVSARFDYSGEEYEAEVEDIFVTPVFMENRWGVGLSGWYFSPGTERKEGRVGVGGDGVGLTYPRMAPNGSTGLFIGASGALVQLEADYTEWGLGIQFSGDKHQIGQSGWTWRPTIGLAGDSREQEIDGDFSSPSFGDTIWGMNNQELNDDFIGVPLGVMISREELGLFGDTYKNFDVRIGGTVTPGYQTSKLDGYMQTTCTPCAAPEDSLRFLYDDKDDGFAWRAEVSAKVGYQVTEYSAISLGVGYRYYDSIAVAEDRISPSTKTSRLGEDSQTDTVFSFTYTIRM